MHSNVNVVESNSRNQYSISIGKRLTDYSSTFHSSYEKRKSRLNCPVNVLINATRIAAKRNSREQNPLLHRIVSFTLSATIFLPAFLRHNVAVNVLKQNRIPFYAANRIDFTLIRSTWAVNATFFSYNDILVHQIWYLVNYPLWFSCFLSSSAHSSRWFYEFTLFPFFMILLFRL